MRGIMVLFDTDEAYAVRFAQYAGRRRLIPFEIQVFTKKEKLARFMQDSRVEILLTAEEGIALAEGKNCLVVRLAGDGAREHASEKGSSVHSVSRYQPVSGILREVMQYYEKESRGNAAGKGIAERARTKLVGVYSPVGRSLKTSFALTLGLMLAREKPALYLNFEPFSGFERLLGTTFGHDVTDVLYFIKTGRGDVTGRIDTVLGNIGELSIVPPASGGTLRQVSAGEWEALLETVREMGRFAVAVIDFAEVPDLYPGMLGLCDVVYMPAPGDAFSQAKVLAFEEAWQDGSGMIRKLVLDGTGLPETADNWPFVLPYTQLGAAAEYVIRRDGL